MDGNIQGKPKDELFIFILMKSCAVHIFSNNDPLMKLQKWTPLTFAISENVIELAAVNYKSKTGFLQFVEKAVSSHLIVLKSKRNRKEFMRVLKLRLSL